MEKYQRLLKNIDWLQALAADVKKKGPDAYALQKNEDWDY